MCKKLIFLISFVLVLGLGSNVLALDLEMPDFAGGDQTCAVLWEFEEGNSVTAEASDQPSLILYDPEPPDACFGFRYAGFSYTGEEDPNLAFFWDSNGTVVVPEEESLIQPVPDGEGDNLTVQVQVMWWPGPNTPNAPSGTNYLSFAVETWEGKGVEAEEGGEWVDGIGNEEGIIDLSPIAEVNIAPGWKHTTYRHTFEDFSADIDVTHVHILFFGYEHGTSGLKLDEVVVDMVIHDGADPEEGPGRLWLRIPRAGQARNPVPANGAEHVLPDANLSWAPDPCLSGPLTYDVYFGTDPNMANNAKIASNIGANTVDPCAGDLADATVYYWRVNTNDANGGGTPVLHTGLDWQFTTWGLADDPEPRNGESGAETSTDLSWVKDDYADSFDVYFGTSYTDVNDATTSTAGIYRGGSTGTWVDPCDANNVRYLYDIPGILDMLKQCYWRIDEINTPKAATVKGDIWTFRTEAHFDLEDFDSYVSTDDLYDVWNDYYINDSDAGIGLVKAPGYVLDGYALQLDYENVSKSAGSYVGSFTDADVADLEGGTDWTVSGIKALVLHFLGQPGNQATANEKMWVEIEDTSSNVGLLLYDGDPNDVQVASWHDWNVDLGIFDACGVTLSAVSKIRIGFGGEIRTGQSADSLGLSTVYFDELELHPRRCVPAVSLSYGDLDGDCNVGAYDLQVMAGDWVEKDYQVDPVPPDRNNLVVEYLFDTDANYNDTSGNGHHGQPSASLTSVAGGYLMIENVGGYVDVPLGTSNPFDGSEDFSIFITYRSDAEAVTVLISSTDPCLPTDWDDPNVVDIDEVFTTYSPMMLYLKQAIGGGPTAPDELTLFYDNFFKNGVSVTKTVQEGIGSWHSVAATYDADGGVCPDEPWDANACPPGSQTGLLTVYFDGTKGPDQANFDPNIPDIADDIVRIGDGYNSLHLEDLGLTTHIGDINEVLIYDVALTEAEVYYLSGIVDPTYVPNPSVANLVPKTPPGGPYDANNMDIINFLDYEKLAERWLTGPYLWP